MLITTMKTRPSQHRTVFERTHRQSDKNLTTDYVDRSADNFLDSTRFFMCSERNWRDSVSPRFRYFRLQI